MSEENKNSLKSLFETSNSFIVVLPPDPGSDILSSGLALHLALKSANKTSQIGCETDISHYSNIKNISEIKESVGDRNLQISFDYPEENLEKVDYDTLPNGKFCLLIKPKPGASAPDISGVKYSYSGANADLVIVLGITSLEELGKIYADEKRYFDSAKILSLSTSPKEASFTPNMLHATTLSYAELVALLLEKIGLPPTPDGATTLLESIYSASSQLTSPKMTADTFSGLAYLMRNGASLPSQHPANPFVQKLTQPAFFDLPSSPKNQEQPPVPQDWKTPKIFRANS
jgi:hypothetical protein